MSQRYYSNVYWHFTGSLKGIDWSVARSPKDILEQGAVLDDDKAVETVVKIMESRKLLATCTEKITEGLVTIPFCCVTDIPFKDPPSHALYYGKVAIGFKPKPVQRHFVPVL
jgi:Putative abortive phage resistance protein AbiGi, antitoxin